MGAFLQVEMPPDNKPGTTMQQICNTALLMKANGMFWNVLSDGSNGDWAQQVRPVINNPANKLNPNAPLSYTSGTPNFDYFVGPNGNDGGAGTLGSPWSITAFNSQQAKYAGKRIGIIGDVGGVQTPIQQGNGGTLYSLMQTINQPNGTGAAININGGTAAAPTYVASCTSAGVYQAQWAIIDCANPSGGAAPVGANGVLLGQPTYNTTVVPNLGYVTLDGLVIRNANYAAVQFGAIQTQVINGIIIKNCQIDSCVCTTSAENPGGIFFGNCATPQVLNTKIFNCTTSGGSNFPLGMGGITSYKTTGLIGTNLTIYGCGYSIQMKDTNQWGTFSYCYFDCGTFGSGVNASQASNPYALMGIIPGSGQALTLHHCIILGLGIRCYGEDGTLVTGSIVGYNNTLYTPPQYANQCTALWVTQTGNGPHQWYNNVVYYPTYSGYAGAPYQFGAISFNTNGGLTGTNISNNYYGTGATFGVASLHAGNLAAMQALGYEVNSISGGSPFGVTPVALTPSSFTVIGVAATAGKNGGPCGAMDGTGTPGTNF
jgi:hypothetical protein